MGDGTDGTDGTCRAQFCKARCYRDAWPKGRQVGAQAQAAQAAGEVSKLAEVQEILEGRIFVTKLQGMKDSEPPWPFQFVYRTKKELMRYFFKL